MKQNKTLIVGGGLAGIYLAYLLEQQQQDYLLIEARARLGGRIFSPNGFDMGPAWFWPHQPRINALVEQLALTKFEQLSSDIAVYQTHDAVQLIRNPGSPKSFRLKNGLIELINALAKHIPQSKIVTQSTVKKVERNSTGVTIQVQRNSQLESITGARIVSTLPLRLLAKSIEFSPRLPSDKLSTMAETPTWMAGHAKALIEFDKPFWQSEPHKGEAFSQIGPLMEIHDASQYHSNQYALFGFVGYSFAQRQKLGIEGLKNAVEQQLIELFGASAQACKRITVFDWTNEPFTAVDSDQQPLNYHPRYGIDNIQFWDGKGMLAGTETAREHGGYLEGALESAERAFAVLTA